MTEQAFPKIESRSIGAPTTSPIGEILSTGGLSKREYFAAKALQGILAHSPGAAQKVAISSVEYADALIVELDATIVSSTVFMGDPNV